MNLNGKTVASTYIYLLNQSGSSITLGNGNAVDWASAGVVTTSNISSSATTAVTAGSGLAGGGTVGSLTLNVGSGDGITVNADNISVNSTVVRTTGTQTIGGTKTFDSTIQAVTTGANALTTSRNLWGRSFNGNADVTGSLTGVGDITFGTSTNKITATASTPSANRTYTIPDVGGNASFVMTTGNQDIGGTKEFKTRPTVNGTGVLLSGEGGSVLTNVVYTTGTQTISGLKTFEQRPQINGTGVLLQGEIVGGGQVGDGVGSFIGGGTALDANASYSFIGGGNNSLIELTATDSAILGGSYNSIDGGGTSVIIGGTNNSITAQNCSILGGFYCFGEHYGSTIIADSDAARLKYSKGDNTLSLDFINGVYLTLPQFTGSSNQNGNFGELKVSGSGLYVCTGTGGSGWGRVFLSTF